MHVPFMTMPCATAWAQSGSSNPVTTVTFKLAKVVKDPDKQRMKYIFEEV
jgi:hypothetical protein